MRLGDEPAGWRSQIALFRHTAVEFSIRLVGFQSLDGWGSLVALFVTAGGVGAVSFAAWLSTVGILLLWVAAFNLLPVPPLIGFHFLCTFGRGVTGHELPERTRIVLTWFGLLAMVILFGRAAWVDVSWLWNAWVR